MNDDTPSRLRCGVIPGRHRVNGGFTIVETLIVLAVSGLLLMSSVLLVAGQQRKVEFNQAAEDIRSSINQIIGEVSSGYYPNPGTFKCSASGGVLSIVPATGVQQGSNTGCIFLGKAIEFGVRNTDPQQYVTHTIAGLQTNDGSLSSAKPQAVDRNDARTTATLRNGLRAVSMKYTSGGVTSDIGAVAFVSSLGDHDSSDQLMSGNQQAQMIPVRNTELVPDTTVAGTVAAINGQLAGSPINPDGGVKICFSSDNSKSALVTIGSNGRSLSTKLEIKNSGDCS